MTIFSKNLLKRECKILEIIFGVHDYYLKLVPQSKEECNTSLYQNISKGDFIEFYDISTLKSSLCVGSPSEQIRI